MLYASAISPAIGLISPVIVPRDAAIMSLMLLVATLITICCKVDISDIASESSVFKSGMVACVCVLGVAWLGDTFVSGHTAEIKTFAADTVVAYPALLAVVFFFAAMLLYSQAATAKGHHPGHRCGARHHRCQPWRFRHARRFVRCCVCSVRSADLSDPSGRGQMDDTGTTRIGKWVFNHAFFIPGVLAIVFSVALGFLAISIF